MKMIFVIWFEVKNKMLLNHVLPDDDDDDE